LKNGVDMIKKSRAFVFLVFTCVMAAHNANAQDKNWVKIDCKESALHIRPGYNCYKYTGQIADVTGFGLFSQHGVYGIFGGEYRFYIARIADGHQEYIRAPSNDRVESVLKKLNNRLKKNAKNWSSIREHGKFLIMDFLLEGMKCIAHYGGGDYLHGGYDHVVYGFFCKMNGLGFVEGDISRLISDAHLKNRKVDLSGVKFTSRWLKSSVSSDGSNGKSNIRDRSRNDVVEEPGPSWPGEIRDVYINWSGLGELLRGTVRTDSERSGTIRLHILENGSECTGRFQLQPSDIGSWSLACTNGDAASGTIRGYGKGLGAQGGGEDVNGRKVSLRIAPRNQE